MKKRRNCLNSSKASGMSDSMSELLTSYSELGFGAFISKLTISIILYMLLVRLFDVLFHKKFSDGWKYALSVIIPVILLIPVKIAVPWSVIPLENFNNPLYIKSPDPILVDGITDQNNYFTSAEPENLFLYEALFYIWLAGAVITFAYQMIKLAAFYKRVRKSSVACENTRYGQILGKICYDSRIKKPKLLIFPETDTPFAMGIIKSKIILPSEEFSEKEIEYILRHEVTHIKRKDILIKFLLMIFRCVNWFDPFAYVLVKDAYGDMEITCDEAVSKDFDADEREKYSKTILKGISKAKYPVVTTYLSPSASLTKKRIDAVMTVKALSSAIPFVITFFAVVLTAQVFYAVPDSETRPVLSLYTAPYPMEADPYITTDSWKTAEANSVSEAGEKIFTQYMEMYMGEDVPDYYRIKDYKINGVYVFPNEITKNGYPDFLAEWLSKGVFTKQEYVQISYNFESADQCGNTVHNKNFGHEFFLNGVYYDSFMGFELERDGNKYTAVNIGAVGTAGGTYYHFYNNLTGVIDEASEMAQSGLLDYSWNDTDNPPDPRDICEYSYLQRYNFQTELPDPDLEQAEYFPDDMSFMVADPIFDSEYIETADCKYINSDGFYRLDTSKLNIDESKGFEYCGYEHDIETGESVIFGNVTGDKPHGVKLLVFTETETEYGIYHRRRLHAVEITDELFEPYEFHDSFESVNIPEDRTTAEEILEYMKTPRDGCDFTVIDHRNITEEADGTYAEVRFKGRLGGHYSSDLIEDGGDGYLKVKIT